MKKPKRKQLVQAAQYLVSGGAWFWSGYFIIVLMTPVIGLWWANLLGNGVGITVNFLLQRYWVFDGSRKTKTTTVTGRYVVYTSLNSFILNYLILLGLEKVGVPIYIGQFVASGFFMFWNFIWYKTWVFKESPQAKRGSPRARR